jgi:hypothetical protein
MVISASAQPDGLNGHASTTLVPGVLRMCGGDLVDKFAIDKSNNHTRSGIAQTKTQDSEDAQPKVPHIFCVDDEQDILSVAHHCRC